MAMKVPGEPEARLDAASLRKVLGYSDQHRVVISRALKKAFPEQWPDGRLAEDAFYEALFRLLEDPDSRSRLFDALYALAERKDKANWREALALPVRMTRQAWTLISGREAAKAAVAEGDLSDVWEVLAEEGHPEFGWWYRWVKLSLEAKAERAGGSEVEGVPADPEALESEWRRALEELGHRVAEAAKAPPSEDLVDWLEGALERLAELIRRHAESTNLSGTLQRCTEALDELDAAGLPGVSGLTSRAREALAGTAGPREMLDAWAERLRAKGAALRKVHAREVEHKDAAQSALGLGDYAQVSGHSQQAASARGELDALLADLAALVAEIEAPGAEGPESTDRAASAQGQRGTMGGHGVECPGAPSEVPPAGGDAQGGTAAAQEIKAETGPAADDAGPGPVDGNVAHVPDAPVPEVASGVQPEAWGEVGSAAQPDREALQGVPKWKGASGGVDLPQWTAQVSVQALAGEVMRHEGAQRVQSARALAWALVRDGQIPLAYHMARVAAEVLPPRPGDIRPEPLRAVHLGGYLSSSAGEEVVELGETLRRFYEVGLADGTLRGQRPLALLTFAAVLRPALVAPHATGAEDLLRGLPLDESLSALHALREEILAPDLRYQAMLHLEPGSHLDELRGRAREWWETNRRHNFKYEPATWVWQHLLEKGQTLGDALSIIVDGGPAGLERARELLQGLQSRRWVEKTIRQADQAVRARKASKKPIEAGPRTDMVKRSAELAGVLSEWVEAVGEQTESARAPGREAALRADRERLLGNLDRALAQADSLQQTAELAEGAAAACVAAVLRDVRGRLDGTAAGVSARSAWWRTLNSVLLPSESVVLVGDRWESELGPDPEPLVVLAGLVDPPGWEASFDAANKGCDHARTAQILDWLRYEEKAEALLDSLDLRREEGLRRCRQGLEAELDAARDEVERAATLGYLGEEDRSRLVAALEAASAHSREDLRRASVRVQEVLDELTRRRDRQVSEIRRRIEESGVSRTDPDAHRRICELLEAGDILTASEYVALLEDGQSIPGPSERRDPFKDEFFPGFVERLQEYLGSRAAAPTRDIPEEIARQGQAGPLDMRRVPGAQARSAGDMLRAWLLLKARRGSVSEQLQLFLERFGLSEVQIRDVMGSPDAREQVFDVSARTLADRDICVVPRYGSHAGGQYRVLCVWERPSEEEVLASAQAHSGGRAVIVLYLGQLSVKRRRDLAFRSRERSQTVLVIDETLASIST
jgi:hypothetical protein